MKVAVAAGWNRGAGPRQRGFLTRRLLTEKVGDLARVRSAPRCSGLTAGASGSRSCSAERISTRLIESIPRSSSSCMSSSSISTGYPVFSATICNRTSATTTAGAEAEHVAAGR